MAEANDMYESIHQNLIDAGCNKETTEQCMTFVHENNISALQKQLSQHRNHLLDRVHVHQKEIDCLDYLIYILKNREKRRK